MKTKSKSVKRKISNDGDLQCHLMGVPKKANVGTHATFDYTSNHLHGEGSSSETYGNLQTPSPIDIHMYDARGYSSAAAPCVQMDTNTKHISACTRPNAQNTSGPSMFPMTIDTLTSKQKSNPTSTNLHNSNQKEPSSQELQQIMNRKEVTPPIIDNNDVSYQRAKPASDDNRYTRTTPSASSNTPPTSRRQPPKHKQTDDGTQTSQPRRRRRLTFVTETQRLHNDTNNTNMTTTTEPGQQQSMRRRQRTLSNSVPIEYIRMGNCTCVCRFCGAKFWDCEKNVRSGFGGSPIYNKCCNGGRVVLRPPPEYPEYIKNLYINRHFMENIRAYN